MIWMENRLLHFQAGEEPGRAPVLDRLNLLVAQADALQPLQRRPRIAPGVIGPKHDLGCWNQLQNGGHCRRVRHARSIEVELRSEERRVGKECRL